MREPAEQSTQRDTGSLPATATEPALPSPRPGEGTSWELGRLAPPRIIASLRLRGRRCGSRRVLAPDELRPVRPDAVEHGGELARQRHLRPPHASPLGDVQRPALERAEPGHACQQCVGCVVQRRAHAGVADPRDPAGHVGFAGLVALGRQAKEGADRLGFREPPGVIHPRTAGQRHQRAHARHRHQPPADLVLLDDHQHLAMQLGEFAPHRLARRQQRLDDLLQHGVPGSQLPDARRQLAAAHVADLQPEAA